MTLIGLGGKLRSGKDTVADHLVEQHGFVKLGMSDVMQDVMRVLNPIVDVEGHANYLEDVELSTWTYSEAVDEYGYVEAKERFPEIRRFMQALGTDFGRNMVGENIWVDMVAKRVDELLKTGHEVAVTGIRFPNELAMINSFGGRTWWVERPSQATEEQAPHASENGVRQEDFKRTIRNDSTIAALHRLVDELL